MFLMIDNYDSFVYNLVRYLEELEEDVVVFRNNKVTIEEIEKLNPKGIILSPGPKAPKDAELCLKILHTFKGKIPILGICLGHQCIGYYFGGEITRGKEPIHGKVSLISHNGKGVFKDIKNPLNVTRYHSLIISRDKLPEEIEITSTTTDGVIMGIRHKEYLIEGVQFHPEAELTECGHQILNNFIELCKRRRA
ncbi:aminodeoxychorismate/anthranilate synthase component II [Clostridium polyendosporum]|uniref:Aminodeoxychorismate/anthranilate synthase component II n=1 Tax=Clostridium polyendosporum TaxID=69208 RepID=A0A919S2V8_9CLOT|nr:aminodeoxychorismate/anthranilate synthase component II [Clostridium polyendosporum]GIM29588.1 aminodeoxychorismate/anthranilate synthase component II [Clostridium polyendosporum]